MAERVGLLHAVGDATAAGSFGPGLLPRLYDGYDIQLFPILANAFIGLIVIAVMRTRASPSRNLSTASAR